MNERFVDIANIKTKHAKVKHTSYPIARKYLQELNTPESKEPLIYKDYKEKVVDLVAKSKGCTNAKAKKELEDKILLESENNLLSSISRKINGDTIDRVLRFLPEILHFESKRYNTISTGLGLRGLNKNDGQLSLFLDAEERQLNNSGTDRTQFPVVEFDCTEWAKHIFDVDKPQTTQKRRLSDTIDKLAEFKTCHPLGNGLFVMMPLIEKKIDFVDTNKGIVKTYLSLNPILSLAIQNGKPKDDFALSPPIRDVVKYLTKKIEWNLYNKLTEMYSYAFGAIKSGRTTHKETIEKIYSELIPEKDYKNNHYTKSKKEINVAFQKMQEIGIIEKGSFQKEGKIFVWEWGKDFLKNNN